MGGDSDTSFKIAAGLFGVVICGLLAIGVAKVAFSGGLNDAVTDGGGDDYDPCGSMWDPFYGSPEGGDALTTSYDTHFETGADGTLTMRYLWVEGYADPAGAALAAQDARDATSQPDFQECVRLLEETSDLRTLAPVVDEEEVAAWAMVMDYDGEREHVEFLSWAEGATVARLQIWVPASANAADFVREQYDAARASVREQATR